jgi:MFS superfamily sulfate permease-like transporter
MKDFLASIVVFLVALPLCMGIAIASGVPPALGLITGIVGGIVVGALAGCPLQVSGPAAGLAVFCYQLVQEHGLPMLGWIVLLAGAIQLAAGLLKVGQLFRAISPAVIQGMLAGIGVLIFAGQFHVMVDDKPRGNGLTNLLSIPEAIFKGIFPLDGSTHHLAAIVGLCTIASLIGWNNWAPKRFKAVPGALVGVLVGSSVAALAGLDIKFVDVPTSLVAAANWPDWSKWSVLLQPAILFDALAVAFVASAETLLCATAVDKMSPCSRTNYDRELAAQGLGNMLCGVFGALPMTGVIVRSAANVNAGAETRKSAMLHGAWLLLLVVAFPQVLRLVPTASLAAILVFTGYKLLNIKEMRKLLGYGKPVVAVYFITMFTIVATDMLTGILVGLGLSVLKLVYLLTHVAVRTERAEGRVDLHLTGAATFMRLPFIADTLEEIPLDVEAHIHIGELSYIDHACMDLMADWERQRQARGGHVAVEWNELTAVYRQRNTFRFPERQAA